MLKSEFQCEIRNSDRSMDRSGVLDRSMDRLGADSVNRRLLDRSADWSRHILSRTEGLWIDRSIDPSYSSRTERFLIDHWIDWFMLDWSADRSKYSPVHRSTLDRSLDRSVNLDRLADRSRLSPEHSSSLDRSMDRSNREQSIQFSLDRLGSLVLTKKLSRSASSP